MKLRGNGQKVPEVLHSAALLRRRLYSLTARCVSITKPCCQSMFKRSACAAAALSVVNLFICETTHGVCECGLELLRSAMGSAAQPPLSSRALYSKGQAAKRAHDPSPHMQPDAVATSTKLEFLHSCLHENRNWPH